MSQARNTAYRESAAHRRAIVDHLSFRGLTPGQIATALAAKPFLLVDPRTGAPWTLAVVRKDLRAISARWRAIAVGTLSQRKARLLAEIKKHSRLAWEQDGMRAVLRAISQQFRLYSLDVPAAAEVTGLGVGPYSSPQVSTFSDEELLAIASVCTLPQAQADGPSSATERLDECSSMPANWPRLFPPSDAKRVRKPPRESRTATPAGFSGKPEQRKKTG